MKRLICFFKKQHKWGRWDPRADHPGAGVRTCDRCGKIQYSGVK